MRFVKTPVAAQLTGLSTVTLREWTIRRALIPADLPPKGRGSAAGFTWQTILLLRIAASLRERFHFELQPNQNLFASLKTGLKRSSFIALWGKSLILQGNNGWALVEDEVGPPLAEDAIVLRLQPHLEALSIGFSLPNPTSSPGQLEMFPLNPVAARRNEIATARPPKPQHEAVHMRRKSA